MKSSPSKPSKFITLIDHDGAMYYDGTPVAISHRCEWDGTRWYGLESLLKFFDRDESKTVEFLKRCLKTQSGISHNPDFDWELV